MNDQNPETEEAQDLPQDEIAEEAALKAMAEELLRLKNSLGWQILMRQFAVKVDEFHLALEDVDPADHKMVSSLQSEIRVRKTLPTILEEMIAQGFELETLDEEESGEPFHED